METSFGFIRLMITQFRGCKTSQWRHSRNERNEMKSMYTFKYHSYALQLKTLRPLNEVVRGVLMKHTCVCSLVGMQMRLELGAESTEVTQVWTKCSMRYQVLFHCAFCCKSTIANWTEKWFLSCKASHMRHHAVDSSLIYIFTVHLRLLKHLPGASIPPTAMMQTTPYPSLSLLPLSFPLPALSIPPFPYLPSPPSPLRGSGGRAPSGGGPGCHPRKKNWNWNRIWCIFVSKRQLSSVSLFVNKNWHNDLGV